MKLAFEYLLILSNFGKFNKKKQQIKMCIFIHPSLNARENKKKLNSTMLLEFLVLLVLLLLLLLFKKNKFISSKKLKNNRSNTCNLSNNIVINK